MNSSRSSKRRKFATNYVSSKYTKEQDALFGIFPETLWLLILGNIKEFPQTLFAIANASPVLRNLQQNYKILNLQLFRLVWPTLFHHMIYKADFLINKKFYRSITVRFRSVCKTWCSAIDNFFSNHPGHYQNAEQNFQLNPDKALSDWSSILQALNLQTNLHAVTNERAQKFLPHFQSNHGGIARSPFISGVVVLKYNGGELDDLQDDVVELFGNFIYHCSLEVSGIEGDAYNKLRQLMFQMPNLKSLHVNELHGLSFDNFPSPLPVLANLQCLKFGSIRDFIVNELVLRQNDALTHLEFMDDPYGYSTIQPVNCKNLEYFKARISSKGSLDFLSLANNAHMVEVYLAEHSLLPLFYILQMLKQKLPESCRTLILSPGIGKIKADSQKVRLRLKNVQRLKLVLRDIVSIDFVLGMQNTLEVLHVVFSGVKANSTIHTNYESWKSQPSSKSIMENEEIMFLSCLDNMETSDMWNMLPKLKVFRLDMWSGKKIEHWKRSKEGISKRIWREGKFLEVGGLQMVKENE